MAHIQLRHSDRVAIVDDCDVDVLSRIPWSINEQGYVSLGRELLMHRFIMGCRQGDGQIVDHTNRDKLDNRRCNLRFATPSQNAANKPKTRKSRSRFKGVHPSGKYWAARLGRISFGTYAREEDAAIAYDIAAKARWGEFACLNFPDGGQPPQRRPRHHNALPLEKVVRIRKDIERGQRQVAIAKAHGVSVFTVQSIAYGKDRYGLGPTERRWIPRGGILTDSDVESIRELRAAGWSQQAIADKFSVTQATVSRALRRKT